MKWLADIVSSGRELPRRGSLRSPCCCPALWTTVLIGVVAAACGDTTQTAPTALNLNRPVDVAFACYGNLRMTGGGGSNDTQAVVPTAQPVASCDARSVIKANDNDPQPTAPGQEGVTNVSWFAFILESAPGTVALAQWDTKPPTDFTGADVNVLDANPFTPGKNGITVGENPIAIATDAVGCYEVTANNGSCDMSVLDINSALDSDPAIRVDRLTVKNAAGKAMHAKAVAMAAQPAGGTIGVSCPMQATGIMYVAYPACHLVAGVDVSSGTIVTGLDFAGGTPTVLTGAMLTNVSCPDECSGEPTKQGPARPVALDLFADLRTDRETLVIGADNSPSLTIVELGLDHKPTSLSQIALTDPTGTLGVTAVATSPQIGMGGTGGVINDTAPVQSQFVYAVATDRSVRVADILSVHKECDTQVDPRFLRNQADLHVLSCMPVGAPSTPPRRAGAHGPGIQLIGDAAPTSVAIYRADTFRQDARPNGPLKWIGYFGVITGSNGGAYVFNVDDDNFADFVNDTAPLSSPIPLDIANQLRDAIPDRGLLAQSEIDGSEMFVCNDFGPDPDAGSPDGGPRMPKLPTLTVPADYLAPDKTGQLPSLRQLKCVGADITTAVPELTFAAPVAVRELVYPDLRGLRADEGWALTWEGNLSADSSTTAVNGPPVRTGGILVDGFGLHLEDATRPFCSAGVQPYDIVQLRGCDPANNDTDCPVGYHCFVHPDSQVTGLGACMAAAEADRLATACKEYLTSLRRYTVGKTTTGELQLLPRKHVLRTTPIDGCASDAQCQQLASYALQNASSANPNADTTAPDRHTWTCAADSDRRPDVNNQPIKRCIETCMVDADCVPGSVCQAGLCYEGVVPPQSCVNAPQRYELHAGEAFTMIGGVSGYIHSIIADSSGKCVVDPAAPPTQIGRVPLTAPACDPTADPLTGKKPDNSYEPNPCSLTVDQTDFEPSYVDSSCALANAAILVTRKAEAIRVRTRGMTLTMVDPTYPGDAQCIGDRAANLGKVPLVIPGSQIVFRQTAGFLPLTLPIQPSLPIKVLRGPSQSIWVVDEGDFISTSVTQPSTAGKVFRIESIAPSIVNVLE